MGKTSLWVCDRCGAEEQGSAWPSEWGKLKDKERGDAGETKSEMVCSSCRESFWEWYHQTDTN
jgi:hypothetical protein